MELNKMRPAGLIMALLFLSGSCMNENETGDNSLLGLSFAAFIETPQEVVSRMGLSGVIGQMFDVGDSIGLYAVAYQSETVPYPLSGELNSADNAPYVSLLNNSNIVFNSEDPIRFPSGNFKKLDVYAYYPYSESGFVQGERLLTVAVRTDQSGGDDFWKSDFMTAIETGVTPERAQIAPGRDNCLKFQFCHRLSLVSFQIKQGIEFGNLTELTNPSLKVINLSTKGTYNWAEPDETKRMVVSSASEDMQDITPYGRLTIKEDTGVFSGVSAMLIPQTISKDIPVCEVKAANMTFKCRLDTDLIIEGGKSYLFTLTLNKSEVSGVTVKIASWNHILNSANIGPDLPVIID